MPGTNLAHDGPCAMCGPDVGHHVGAGRHVRSMFYVLPPAVDARCELQVLAKSVPAFPPPASSGALLDSAVLDSAVLSCPVLFCPVLSCPSFNLIVSS
eukprot:1650997-Rhodomonas_salina.2